MTIELPILTNSELIRFFHKIKPNEEHLIWIGAVSNNGYGRVGIRGKSYQVHRLLYSMCKGQPKDVVHHLCTNKLCVKPSHLETMSLPEHTRLEITMNKYVSTLYAQM